MPIMTNRDDSFYCINTCAANLRLINKCPNPFNMNTPCFPIKTWQTRTGSQKHPVQKGTRQDAKEYLCRKCIIIVYWRKEQPWKAQSYAFDLLKHSFGNAICHLLQHNMPCFECIKTAYIHVLGYSGMQKQAHSTGFRNLNLCLKT